MKDQDSESAESPSDSDLRESDLRELLEGRKHPLLGAQRALLTEELEPDEARDDREARRWLPELRKARDVALETREGAEAFVGVLGRLADAGVADARDLRRIGLGAATARALAEMVQLAGAGVLSPAALWFEQTHYMEAVLDFLNGLPSGLHLVSWRMLDAGCEECPDGIELSVTVYFPGVGDKKASGGDFSEAEAEFIDVLSRQTQHGASGEECCDKELHVLAYDRTRTARQNGAWCAARLSRALEKRVQLAPVRKIYLHLVGFSAGGIVAVNTASALPCSFTAPGRTWCDEPLEETVPVELDVGTIATPFDLGWAPVRSSEPMIEGLSFFLDVERYLFACSIGESDYGDDPPSCLCNFTSFVTSDEHDESPGGGKSAEEDDRLEDWDPRDVPVPDVDHLEVLGRVLREHSVFVTPGCRCNRDPLSAE